jgi:GlpG protein
MQPLVKIAQQNIALLFANYLKSVGINAQVQPADKGFDVYCERHQHNKAIALFEEFIKQPYAPKYQQAAWQQGEAVTLQSSNDSFLDTFKTQFLAQAGIVTLTIFALCWLVFFGSLLGFAVNIFHTLQFYPVIDQSLILSQPWRLITPAFFHFSWLHIVFNVLWWWQLGGEIEKRLSKSTLIQLFLFTAVISNVGQFYTAGANFGGLSGVVYGLVGFVWIMGWLAPQFGLSLAKPVVIILIAWMALGFLEFLPINMANAAHLLGFLSGIGFALLYILMHGKRKT